MPVVSRGQVVGIVTETDILRAFIDMMGILGRTARVDVALPVDSVAFRRAVRVIQEAGGDIIHVGMTPRKGKEREYSFRLAAGSTERVRQALLAEGFRLLDEQ
jgi:acetoin utilization protein AcuB